MLMKMGLTHSTNVSLLVSLMYGYWLDCDAENLKNKHTLESGNAWYRNSQQFQLFAIALKIHLRRCTH